MWAHGRYFRVSVRVGSAVKTKYYGTGDYGLMGELIHQRDRSDREARRLEALEERQRAGEEWADDRRGAATFDRMIGAGLEALGYHRPRRNPWRKRRMKASELAAPATLEAADDKATLWKMIGLYNVAKAGGDGHEAAATELEAMCRKHPHLMVEAVAADMQFYYRECRIRNLRRRAMEQDRETAAAVGLHFEGIKRHLRDLERELLGAGPSPALRLAVGAAVYSYYDYWINENIGIGGKLDGNMPYQKRRNWAQGRLLKALAAVERIRAISQGRGEPRIQVNIANVAGRTSSDGGFCMENPASFGTVENGPGHDIMTGRPPLGPDDPTSSPAAAPQAKPGPRKPTGPGIKAWMHRRQIRHVK
jgi:hypothetical protein